MELNKPFKIFSNCIPVRGANRSTICDLQRNDVKLIPNDLVDILLNHEGRTINEIKKSYKNKYDDIISEYFEFLLENEFIFFTDDPELFTKLDLSWKSDSLINNAILDRNSKSDYNLYGALDQLNQLCCQHIEIRFYDIIHLSTVKEILQYLERLQSTIASVDFTLPYNKVKLTDLKNTIKYNKRLASLKIFGCPKDRFTAPLRDNMGYILETKKEVKNSSCCGVVSKDFFVVNTSLFTESQHFNSCLNHKISIDADGVIKNCPTMQSGYGSIKNTKLRDVLKIREFKKYWNISKDKISICKDCEFRYICTDCRAFVNNEKNNFPKPLKCGYNPYSNTWTNWESKVSIDNL